MALCSICQSIPFSSLPDPPNSIGCVYVGDNKELPILISHDRNAPPDDQLWFAWHQHLDALAESAATGCSLCVLVHAGAQTWMKHYQHESETNKGFQEFREDRMPVPKRQALYLTKRFGGAAGFIVLVRPKATSRGTYLLTGVGFSVDGDNPLANVFLMRPAESDSSSLKSLDIARAWVQDCVEKHDKCQNGDESLPSHVIDVGLSGEDVKVTGTEGLTGRYASLSYCCDKVLDIPSSKESSNELPFAITLSSLPKSFQDAVTVTRHIGLPYLWIDKLCIYHDNANIPTSQSARIIDVHSKAQVVISADHAADKSIGLFHHRDVMQRTTINLSSPSSTEEGSVHATLLLPSNEQIVFDGEFSSEPLSERGWALQERVLARRSLHYCSDQMYFECNHGIIGEDGCYSNMRFCDINYTEEIASPISFLYGRDHVLWHNLLRHYGRRKLPRPADKLTAMGGLAKMFKQKFNAEYVVGLWSHALIEGLAWQSLGSRQPMDSNDYVAPSWSWASYDGIAAGGLRDRWTDSAKIIEYNVDLKNDADPFGEIKDAWLRLRAPLATLAASETDSTDHEARLAKAGMKPFPRVRTKYSADEDGDVMLLDYESVRTSAEWREWDLRVLLLGWYEKESCEADEKQRCATDPAFCLVVRPMSNGTEEKHMNRVGWMFLSGDEARRLREDEASYETVKLV